MKKILLVGELNEIVRSLNECLSGDFQVQLCAGQLESVKAMHNIIKPSLIMISQISMEEMDVQIMEWLKESHGRIPVLIITTTENWPQIKPYCELHGFHKIFRPVAKKELLEKCYELLGITQNAYHIPKYNGKKKILIVDDSPTVLRNIKSLLDKQYEIFLATSGEKALKMLRSNRPDLVLLDYEMPGMNGKMTFEAMLADEYAKEIPVIFLTSIAERKQIYEVLKSYPAGYILKPPEREHLFRTIEEVLRKNGGML